ncbi:hypothetical protein [Mariniphaga sp.]|uniref:hypothetical protein n=1 Tax=Mariniphaga sp. TaxID=1954475 RepID=UPI003563D317
METGSLSEIKKELKTLSPQQLQEICIRLAKYKKENKELLSYLLFETQNEQAFIESVKEEMDEQFTRLNRTSLYLAKKTLRKVLRTTNKYIRFSGSKQTEIELRLYFCEKMREMGYRLKNIRVLFNMYQRQVHLIHNANSKLHEDLQYDYEEAVKKLSL